MTMHAAIKKLLSVASDPIGNLVDVEATAYMVSSWGGLGQELAEMLTARNGFYAFEASLLVRPLRQSIVPLGVFEWNARDLWRGHYVDDLADVLFFGEDLFGGQFAIRNETVCAFDPETGQLEVMASSLGAWANGVLADYEFRTGHPLAHAWQLENGPLAPGIRLLPKLPFVCGGKYAVENLYPSNDVKGMLFRASIANQIRDLPDGSQIIFDVSGPES
jgi:hypothetical protein